MGLDIKCWTEYIRKNSEGERIILKWILRQSVVKKSDELRLYFKILCTLSVAGIIDT